MRVVDILQAKKPAFSFEFFPPKSDEEIGVVLAAARELKAWDPGFISVTWGAGGGTRRKTLDLVAQTKAEVGVEAMAHLTCVGAGRGEIDGILEDIHARGIENILALRGDPPRGGGPFQPHPGGFRHAFELVAHIRARWKFCLGVAGYPEGHVENPDKESDLDHLKRKLDAGADFVVTQLFFDNADFLRFRDRAAARGIRQPILPGLMPVTNVAQLERFTTLCGARIPADLSRRLAEAPDGEAVVRVGIEHAARQCRGLLSEGVPGVHFYTLNRSRSTAEVLRLARPLQEARNNPILPSTPSYREAP